MTREQLERKADTYYAAELAEIERLGFTDLAEAYRTMRDYTRRAYMRGYCEGGEQGATEVIHDLLAACPSVGSVKVRVAE